MDPITAKVHKAVEIMKTAIVVYNNNMIVTRSETFIVLGVIAWEDDIAYPTFGVQLAIRLAHIAGQASCPARRTQIPLRGPR